MQITGVIILACCLQISASASGQKVTIKHTNLTLREVFKDIHKQTNYNFIYSDKTIQGAGLITLDIKNASIQDVLNTAFAGKPLTYIIEDRVIIVKSKPAASRNVPDIPAKEISGRVTDSATGQPLAGVTIKVRGENTGAVTDAQGKFTLEVSNDVLLEVSYLGYVTKTMKADGKSTLNITLTATTTGLNQLVVVGYGTQKKKDLTGAVAVITSEDLKDKPIVNFGEAMASQLAGVQVQQINGAPGGEGLTVRVRGTGSITQSNSPLYVVDGYPMEGGAFRLINPNDIESLQVLKDASSTAIYGSRGANGVVIITTKRGKAGAPAVSLNVYSGFQQRTKTIPVMNRDQYVQWFIDGRNQAWLDRPVINADPDKSPHTTNDPNSRRSLYPSASSLYIIPDGQNGFKYNFLDPKSVAQMPDNNWQDLLFRTAPIQQYEVSVSGGSEKNTYAFSGSYLNQKGISLGTGYERFNFRNSTETQVNKQLRLGMHLNVYTTSGDEQVNGKYSPIQFALQLPPIYDLHNADGTYGSMVRNPEVLAGDVSNPIGVAELVKTHRKRYGWLGTVYGELELIDNLKYRININGSIQDNILEDYEPSYVDLDASKGPRPAEASNDRHTDYDWVIEQTLTYAKTFAEKHDVVFLGGFSSQKHNNEYTYGEARGFPNDNIQTLNAGNMYELTSTKSVYSMLSYFARANYTFNNRYLLTATIRTDGSSRFGENKKWGVFPSASAAWRISEENFMSGISAISNLKLRASYGIAGNNRIGDYSAIGLLSTGFYPTGGTLQNTVNPSTVPNRDLGWEKVLQSDIGLDLGLFNNRIIFESDFYNSKSIDLLLKVPIPTVTGYSSQIRNIGQVLNRGIELSLTTRNLTRQLKWSSNFNIAFNKNKVLELGPGGQPIYASAPNANNAFITKPGYPIASFYGYVYEGVFMDQKELDTYPHLPTDKVGDGRYLDVNGDGKMDQNDKAIIGNNQPKFIGGFGNDLSYKNFTLSAQLSFSYGAQAFSFFERMIGVYHGDRNALVDLVHRWRSETDPGDGVHFRATRNPIGWQRDPSSAWVTDISYLRLRDLTLAYNFSKSRIIGLGVKGVHLYTTGQNLFTWTKYPGYDPETSSEGDGLTKGGDYMGYPAARSIIVGVNLDF